MKLVAYKTSYLVAAKGQPIISQRDSIREAIADVLKSVAIADVLKSVAFDVLGNELPTFPTLLCTAVKKAIFEGGTERIISQVPHPLKSKTITFVLNSIKNHVE